MNRDKRISVYLADDHEIVLKGIISLFEFEPDLRLVGYTTHSGNVVPAVVQLKPQVLVLDLGMPGIPGGELIRTLRSIEGLRTQIVVFTMHKDISFVVQALDDGALGYVIKDADSFHLIEAIRAAARGLVYLSPPFSDEDLREYREQLRMSKMGIDLYEKLTPREREVLRYVAQGYTNREMAEMMHLSVRTVEKHRYNMMKKAAFKNRTEVIQFALRRGLILPPDAPETSRQQP